MINQTYASLETVFYVDQIHIFLHHLRYFGKVN